MVARLSSWEHLSPINMASRDVDMVDAAARVPDVPDPNDGNAHLLQTNHSDAFAFSATEELALQLYDQLEELELQQSLIQAHRAGMFHIQAASLQNMVES